tara:strand:- start:16 stop:678 length:663 start_codon:yes stop_codon:yes gene_type:complete
VTTYKQITTAYNNLQTNKQRMSHYAEDGTLKFETPQQEILFLKQQLASSHMIRDEQEKTIEKYRKVQEENERLYDENAELTDRVMYLEKELDEVQDDFNEEEEKVETLETEIERLENELHAYKNTEYDDIQNIQELQEENKQLKDQLTKQHEYVDTMEYETKIEQLEGFNGGQEFWNDAEDVLEVLQNDGFDEEEIKRIIEDKCSGYTFDIDKEELVKVE